MFAAAACAAAEQNGYLDALVNEAHRAALAQEPQWRALLHFESSFFGAKSKAEPSSFFLAVDGRQDPQAELDATLKAFFESQRLKGRDETSQCAFPARYQWLKSKLKFDPILLPQQKCPQFDQWLSGIDPHGITMILASSYMNNPASAFGHTLLRLDRTSSDARSTLLDYAVNYAAATDDANALLYAVKGIMGGYQGFFSVSPYYEKVKLYSDLENRDIWEYKLNLLPAEVDLLVRHLWELQGVPFLYYYFDENCSYQLLSLLEVARPTLKLRSKFGSWVIPVETLQAVVEESALAAAPEFRPSAATKLQNRIAQAGDDVKRDSKRLALDSMAELHLADLGLSDQELAESLDLANEFLAYRIMGSADDQPILEERAFLLLNERSRIPLPDSVPTPLPPAVSPEAAHAARKFSMSVGLEDNKSFYQLSFRPTYHELPDPEGGYNLGSQISMLRTDFSFPAGERPRIERFDLLDLASITPRNDFVKPFSWYFKAGAERWGVSPEGEDLIWSLKGGFGYGWSILDRALVYLLNGPALHVGSDYERAFAVGVSHRIGSLLILTNRLAVMGEFNHERLLPDNNYDLFGLETGERYTLSRNLALRLSQRFSWGDGDYSSQFLFHLEKFF